MIYLWWRGYNLVEKANVKTIKLKPQILTTRDRECLSPLYIFPTNLGNLSWNHGDCPLLSVDVRFAFFASTSLAICLWRRISGCGTRQIEQSKEIFILESCQVYCASGPYCTYSWPFLLGPIHLRVCFFLSRLAISMVAYPGSSSVTVRRRNLFPLIWYELYTTGIEKVREREG